MLARILVVDDDKDHLEMFKDTLTVKDYDVCTAQNPAEAFKALSKKSVDLAIVDRNLYARENDGTGITLSHYISRRWHVPTLLMSCEYLRPMGFGTQGEQDIAAAGAEAIIALPARIEDFVKTVEGILARDHQ